MPEIFWRRQPAVESGSAVRLFASRREPHSLFPGYKPPTPSRAGARDRFGAGEQLPAKGCKTT